jgi:hypothetical protein
LLVGSQNRQFFTRLALTGQSPTAVFEINTSGIRPLYDEVSVRQDLSCPVVIDLAPASDRISKSLYY